MTKLRGPASLQDNTESNPASTMLQIPPRTPNVHPSHTIQTLRWPRLPTHPAGTRGSRAPEPHPFPSQASRQYLKKATLRRVQGFPGHG